MPPILTLPNKIIKFCRQNYAKFIISHLLFRPFCLLLEKFTKYYFQTILLQSSSKQTFLSILSKQMKSGNESGLRASCLVHFNGSTDYVDMSGYIYNYTDASATDNLMKGHADQMITYMLGFRVD